MITPKDFVNYLKKKGINFFSGVPDSVLKSLINYLQANNKFNHEIAVNEGSAISLGIGFNLATKKIPLIYFQNSGLGHALNPISSMADKNIFSIPMLILVGRRGKPGIKDEPQHKVFGPRIFKIISAAGLKAFDINPKNFKKKISYALKYIKKNSAPAFIIVDKNFFLNFKSEFLNKRVVYKYKRINYIETILKNKKKSDIIIGSTGFASRELFYLNEKLKLGHKNSFYCIGAMGHANQIAYIISKIRKNKRIFILDGDGAVQMHMGNLVKIADKRNKNILHIIFNNNVHESTGNHFVANTLLSYKKIFKAFNYKNSIEVKSTSALKKLINKKNFYGPAGIEVKINPGTIKNLPRPHLTTLEQKKLFIV